MPKFRVKSFLGVVTISCLLGLLFLVSQSDFLLFHLTVEFIITVVSITIFVVALNTYPIAKNDFFLFLGTAYFFVAILNFFHIVTYKGMNLLTLDANTPTQFWLSNRYLMAAAFLTAPFFLGRKLNLRYHYLFFLGFFALSTVFFLGIYYYDFFPTAYADGVGLTTFKVYSEYVVSFVLFLALLNLIRKRKNLDIQALYSLSVGLIFLIMGELAFTHYVSVVGNFNVLGHFFILISTLFIYRALISKTLKNPYDFLFKELSEANKKLLDLSVKDGLTGLLNQKAVIKETKDQFEVAKRLNRPFSVVMMDLDDFKAVNDIYGHLAGDKVLKKFASILKKTVREIDIVGRFGGDEFLICPIEAGKKESEAIVKKITGELKKTKVKVGNSTLEIKCTFGCSSDKSSSINQIIHQADSDLLRRKREAKALEIGIN